MNFIKATDELHKAIDAQEYSGSVRLIRLAGLKRATEFCESLDRDMDVGEALSKYYAHLKTRLIDDNITAYQFQNEVEVINFVQVHYTKKGNFNFKRNIVFYSELTIVGAILLIGITFLIYQCQKKKTVLR